MLELILSHLDFLDELIETVSKEVQHRIRPFLRVIELLKTTTGVEQRVAENMISEIGGI
jgi:hypothetical protein